jgi:phosphopantetheine adenylyltransferase/dephospho-CoA kinase
MPELDIVTISLVGECCKESEHEEDKVSSSSLRIRKLGTLIHEPPQKSIPMKPYLIGLTGGIASGKSNIAKEMEMLGAGLIDCDKVAHRAYEIDSPGYLQIVAAFGEGILQEYRSIDRRKLGAIVFSEKSALKKLEDIVWPTTRNLVEQEIEKLANEGKEIIVVEAALLLEANWDEKLHQVWVTVIPETEAIKRLEERSGLDEEEAKKRINAQLTNFERVQKANVVFCTLWDYEFTKKQVAKAWNMLHERFLK